MEFEKGKIAFWYCSSMKKIYQIKLLGMGYVDHAFVLIDTPIGCYQINANTELYNSIDDYINGKSWDSLKYFVENYLAKTINKAFGLDVDTHMKLYYYDKKSKSVRFDYFFIGDVFGVTCDGNNNQEIVFRLKDDKNYKLFEREAREDALKDIEVVMLDNPIEQTDDSSTIESKLRKFNRL